MPDLKSIALGLGKKLSFSPLSRYNNETRNSKIGQKILGFSLKTQHGNSVQRVDAFGGKGLPIVVKTSFAMIYQEESLPDK